MKMVINQDDTLSPKGAATGLYERDIPAGTTIHMRYVDDIEWYYNILSAHDRCWAKVQLNKLKNIYGIVGFSTNWILDAVKHGGSIGTQSWKESTNKPLEGRLEYSGSLEEVNGYRFSQNELGIRFARGMIEILYTQNPLSWEIAEAIELYKKPNLLCYVIKEPIIDEMSELGGELFAKIYQSFMSFVSKEVERIETMPESLWRQSKERLKVHQGYSLAYQVLWKAFEEYRRHIQPMPDIRHVIEGMFNEMYERGIV